MANENDNGKPQPLPVQMTPSQKEIRDEFERQFKEHTGDAAKELDARAAKAAEDLEEHAAEVADALGLQARHTPAHGFPAVAPVTEGPAAQASARWGMLAVVAMVGLSAIGGIIWLATAGAQAAEANTTAKATALDLASVKADAQARADAIKKQREDHDALEARVRLQEQTAAATLNALQNLKETTARIEAKLDAKK